LPQKGEIRIAPVAVVPDLLREFGVAPGPLLKPFGLTEAYFRNPDNTVSYELMGQIIKAGMRATACPHFGLLIGQRGDASTLGAPGFLLRHAPDVVTALNEAISNLDLHDRGATAFIEVGDATTLLGYTIYNARVEAADQIGDTAVAMMWNIMRSLCGPEWKPIEVCFRHDAPADLSAHRRYFSQAPLRFNAAHNALIFATEWLARPLQQADPLLRRHLLQHIDDMRRYTDQDFRDKAYRALLLLLGKRPCTLEEMARHFSMHPRTLNRRLKDSGTSFRELYTNARHHTARQLLCDTRTPIEAIASLLGYSDATAFNRAFARWEGIPPAAWRRRSRMPGGGDAPGEGPPAPSRAG
jgi:AraC-like DNA-binding protein